MKGEWQILTPEQFNSVLAQVDEDIQQGKDGSVAKLIEQAVEALQETDDDI